MFNGRDTSQDKKNNKPRFEFGFFSALAAVINFGKFWLCIRWCDEGSTLFITSPLLFERDDLQNEHQELLLNIKDFASFIDALGQLGFEKVLSNRSSKVPKFRHPCFKKDEGILRRAAEKRAQRQRKVLVGNYENCRKRPTSVKKEKLTQRVKRPSLILSNDSARTAIKRKRNAEKSSHIPAPVKRRKNSENFPASALTNCDKPTQQMRKINSTEEMTAAQALLSLSTLVLLLPNNTAVELMAAESLVDLSRSCVVPQRRSFVELEAAEALLEVFKSPYKKLFKHTI